MKNLFTILFLVCALSLTGLAQNPVYTLPITVSAPSPVSNVTVQVSGTAGQTYYCYWVVAQYTVGYVIPSQPACIYNAPNTLNGSNYDIVSWSSTGGGTPTFGVVRCTPTALGSTCTFPGTGTTAVTASTSSLSANDQSNSLNSYTYTNAPPATFTLQMNNRDFSTPALTITDNNSNVAFRLTQTASGSGSVTANLAQFVTTNPYTTFTTISMPSGIATNATTDAANTTYVSPIWIPNTFTSTGACILNGGTVGTDKTVLVIYNNAGAVVANTTTASSGTTTANASKYQCIAWTATVTLNGPQLYWIGKMSNGTTDNFQTYAANSVPTNYFTGTVSQTYASGPATIAGSLPSSFNANQGPIMAVY